MARGRIKQKGIVLFIVVATIFIVILLGNILLSIITSHARLTHHQVSRIQAYYVALAGMNLALERLRIGPAAGGWIYEPAGTNSCPNANPCSVTDANFPPSVQSISVIFCPSGSICTGSANTCSPPTGNNFCIYSIANYTYTP